MKTFNTKSRNVFVDIVIKRKANILLAFLILIIDVKFIDCFHSTK